MTRKRRKGIAPKQKFVWKTDAEQPPKSTDDSTTSSTQALKKRKGDHPAVGNASSFVTPGLRYPQRK